MNLFYAYIIPVLLKFLNSRSTEFVSKLTYTLILISLAVICYFTSPIVCLCSFVFTTIPGALFSHLYFSGRLFGYFNTLSNNTSAISQSQHPDENFQNSIPDVAEAESESDLEMTLSHFTDVLLDNFVSEWYSSVSESEDFSNKCYPHIYLALSNLCERASSLPLTLLSTHLLLKGLIPFFNSLEEAVGELKGTEGQTLIDKLLHARTVHSFEASVFAHPALRNAVATHKYGEHIFDTLFQASELSPDLKNSFLFRSVLRDVISTSFLQRLFEIFSKPQFIYQCLAFVFSPQFNSNSNPTRIPRCSPQNIIVEDANTEIFEDSISVTRTSKLFQSRKSKSCDTPDKYTRIGNKKSSQPTNTACEIDTLLRMKKAEMTMNVPLRARRDSISIFDHEVMREANSSPYYIYSIWVPNMIANRSSHSDGFIVKHRVQRVRTALQNTSEQVQVIDASKISQIRIGSLTPHFIMRRRMLLENFLKAVCVRVQLLQVPDLQAFLGLSSRRTQESLRQSNRMSRVVNNTDLTANQNVEDIVLKLRVFVTKHLLYANDSNETIQLQSIEDSDSVFTSLSSHTTTLPTQLQDIQALSTDSKVNLKDDVFDSKTCRYQYSFRNLIQTNLLNVLNGVDIQSQDQAGFLMERLPFTSSLYLFGVTALRNKQLWLHNETSSILLLEMLGESTKQSLQTKMDALNTTERLCVYFEMLENKFFPNGKLKLSGSNPPSKAELERMKSMACGAIYNFMPELIKYAVGENQLKRTIYYCLDCLSCPDMNRHLLLRLFDIILLYIVPEMSEANFQRLLGIGTPC